jgi:hypothetical protein
MQGLAFEQLSVFRDKLSTSWIRYETSLIVWTCVYILHNMDIVVYKLHNYAAPKSTGTHSKQRF